VTPRPPEAYVCPICLEFFTEQQLDLGELTDEHVPPESVGGKALVLTCRTCNRDSGALLDRAVAAEEKLRTFGKPYAVGSIPGTLIYNGTRNNGSIRFDGETFQILGDPGQNNPGALAAHMAALDEGVGPGEEFRLELRVKTSPAYAPIGWMRSAYLAAFAVYGYRYVLQPAFEPLREAIRNPKKTDFDAVVLQGPDDGPLDPLIAEVFAPASIVGGLAVTFGPRVILLPPWHAPANWFATLRERLASESADNLSLGSNLGRRFPEYPMHLTDG